MNDEELKDAVEKFWEKQESRLTNERRFLKVTGCLVATFYGFIGLFFIAWILGCYTLLWLGIRWLWLNT